MSDSTPPPPPEGESYQPPQPPAGESQPTPGYAAPPPPPPTGEPGYGAGYGAPVSGAGQPADLLMRFLARLIDGILIGIVNAIIVAILIVGVMGASGGGYGMGISGSWGASAVAAIIDAALYLGYFSLMESRNNGQTVGKLLLKLRTLGPDGNAPTLEEALRRNAWAGLGILGVVPFLGIVGSLLELAAVIAIAVTINNSPTKQGWHDNFAGGTRVVKLG